MEIVQTGNWDSGGSQALSDTELEKITGGQVGEVVTFVARVGSFVGGVKVIAAAATAAAKALSKANADLTKKGQPTNPNLEGS
jgi:hypothetical protein